MNAQQTKRISKKLSLLLRHRPELFQLQLDKQGWCEVNTLLAAAKNNNFSLDRKTLELVVAENDKQRFSFSEDGTKIRANQGHSIKIELGYSPTEPPELLYHGTATRFMNSIRKTGLQRRNRHHVHLSADINTAQKVGARHGVPIILNIRAKQMYRAGHEFFLSENGVWLTDNVPTQYFD
ncbi:MAG: RNA 2'-phosphotransferase [Saprospiraceae bacterium]